MPTKPTRKPAKRPAAAPEVRLTRAARLVQIRQLLGDIEHKRRELNQDKRSTAAYWNGDDWGSMDGINDATNWVERNLAEYVMQRLDRLDTRR